MGSFVGLCRFLIAGMHQVCGRSRRPCAWLRSEMVTCHYSDTLETRRIGACMSEDEETST